MENNVYEVIKIGDGSWRIEDSLVRAFLFTGTDRALLVDTGFGPGNIRTAVEEITKLPIMLVNTHGDKDHIGGNKFFEKAYMHPAEYVSYYEYAPVDANVAPLWDGSVIDLGSRSFDVILIPGHTPGSIALLDRENRLLIAGDSISEGPIFMFGKTRNMYAFINSMERLEEIGGFDTVYPSHGPFPVKPALIRELINGASSVLDGKVEPQEPPFEIPAKMYVAGEAKFFYSDT